MVRLVCIMILLAAWGMSSEAKVRRALIIGLGKQMDSRWGKIHGDNDVYYVEQMLRSVGFTDIKTMKNEQATKLAIVKAFKDLAIRSKRGDVVYIHYSGHGQLMTDVNGDEATRWKGRHSQWDESWIPYDAYMTYGKEDHGEKHLSDDEIAELLTEIRLKIGDKGQITVAIDACHSGDATCGQEGECVRGIDQKFNIPMNKTKKSTQRIEEKWRTISACKPYQLCMEIKDLNVGKLTYALCSLGKQTFTMSNEQLEKLLNEMLDMYKGRLPQQPMVSGKK